MMKNINFFTLIAWMIMLFGCEQNRFTAVDENEKEEVSLRSSGGLSWDFPVKPGTEEWKQFNSVQEMVEACQIPSEVLTFLSTEDLSEICLNYPLLFTFTAFNHWDYGLDVQFKNFNGLRELFKRKEASNELLKLYQAKLMNLQESKNPEEFIIILANLELLLSRLHTLNHLTKDDFVEILRHLVIGFESKLMHPETFGSLSLSTNFFSRAYILEKINPKYLVEHIENGHNNFVFGGLPDWNAWNYIVELSYSIISP